MTRPVRRREPAGGHSANGVHNRVTISALTSAQMGRGHTMRIFGLGIGFLIVWLFARHRWLWQKWRPFKL
jgi:hypothetical protein